MMDFSAGAGQSSGSGGVIPNGQLAWVIINVRGVKASSKGGAYIDMELTLDEGQPYGRKKIWTMVGDPLNMGNSEAYRQMGMVAISRILETARGAGPNNPAGYKLDDYSQLSGLRAAIKVKVIPAKDGYDEKNDVGEWLTPNPASQTGHKEFVMLQQGAVNVSAGKAQAASQAASGFGNAGGFGGQQIPQQPSFSQPQQPGAFNSAAASSTMTTSPSSGGGWLQQANGG